LAADPYQTVAGVAHRTARLTSLHTLRCISVRAGRQAPAVGSSRMGRLLPRHAAWLARVAAHGRQSSSFSQKAGSDVCSFIMANTFSLGRTPQRAAHASYCAVISLTRT